MGKKFWILFFQWLTVNIKWYLNWWASEYFFFVIVYFSIIHPHSHPHPNHSFIINRHLFQFHWRNDYPSQHHLQRWSFNHRCLNTVIPVCVCVYFDIRIQIALLFWTFFLCFCSFLNAFFPPPSMLLDICLPVLSLSLSLSLNFSIIFPYISLQFYWNWMLLKLKQICHTHITSNEWVSERKTK